MPKNNDEVTVLAEIISALKPLEPAERIRLLQTVSAFFGHTSHTLGPPPGSQEHRASQQGELRMDHPDEHGERVRSPSHPGGASRVPGFSEGRLPSAKDFLLAKQPHTDVERIACLAYYLAHHRNTPHFKTLDLSKLNTEAAQPKFSNPAVACDNAVKAGLLVPAGNAQKQLTGPGERFVEALPDREAARAVREGVRTRSKKRRSGRTTSDK